MRTFTVRVALTLTAPDDASENNAGDAVSAAIWHGEYGDGFEVAELSWQADEVTA